MRGRCHFRDVEVVTVAPHLLRPVHGDIDVAILAGEYGDADAGGGDDFVALDAERSRQVLAQAHGQCFHGLEIIDIGRDDRELIAAETGDGIAVADAPGGQPQQRISYTLTQ